MSTTDVALSGVTATVRTCSSGSFDTSWIESTAPSEDTQSRGRSRSRSAFRAHSIDGIGATSTSPASRRRARSVGTPLEQVRTVAVTPESATSVVLVKVLLPEAEHVPLGEEADAQLLIGDAALKSAFEDPTPHHDLGRLWLERTGLPMVFAVWACPEPLQTGLSELEDALVASVRLARAEPERLAHEASERYGYPAGFLARYFEKLRYRFGPRERAGLMTFLELAHEAGELDEVPELRFVQTKAGAAVA